MVTQPKKMKKILVLLCLGVLFAGCKKESSTPNTSTGNSNTGTVNSGYITPVSAIATEFSGIFTSWSYTNVLTGGGFSGKSPSAYFSRSPVAAPQFSTSITVKKVLLGSDSLRYDSSIYRYMPWMAPKSNSNTWKVDGNNGIPSFIFTDNQPTPSCSSFSQLPDEISISQGTVIKLNNLDHFVDGYFSISDNGDKTIINFLSKGITEINLSPGDLQGMKPTDQGFMVVYLRNTQAVKASNKNFQFVKAEEYFKAIKIKP